MIVDESFWSYTGAPFPWGPFDPEDDLAFTFDFSQFAALAGTSLTVASVVPMLDPLLEVVDVPSLAAGVYTIRLKRNADPLPAGKTQMQFTLRPVLSDGQGTDRTFILRLRDS